MNVHPLNVYILYICFVKRERSHLISTVFHTVRNSPELHLLIEMSSIMAYAKDADEFVRQSCRDRTGWRRDEWAYGPLFIWANFSVLAASLGCRDDGSQAGSNPGGSGTSSSLAWAGRRGDRVRRPGQGAHPACFP